MLEIRGKKNNAICFASQIDEKALEQIKRMCDYDLTFHGAGRILSRQQAKEMLDIKEYKKSMEGIYTTSISLDTLDEAPQAYKSVEDILDVVGETVDVIEVLKPVYNYKEHGNEKRNY